MRTVRLLAVRAFAQLVFSPFAAATLVLFLAATSILFLLSLQEADGTPANLAALWSVSLCRALPLPAALYSMGLWADARRDGRQDLLLVLPVSEGTLVLGRYLGGLAMTLLAVALAFAVPFAFLPRTSALSPGVVELAPAFVGASMFAAFLTALGSLASAVCRRAAVAGFVTILFTGVLPQAAYALAVGWSALLRTSALAYPIDRFASDFATGFISPAAVFFFLSFAAWALYATSRAVASSRWVGRAGRARRLSAFFASSCSLAAVALAFSLVVRFDLPFELPLTAREAELSDFARGILTETNGGAIRITAFMSRRAPEARRISRLFRVFASASRAVGGVEIGVAFADPHWDIGEATRLARAGVREGSVVFERVRPNPKRRFAVPVAELDEPTCARTIQRLFAVADRRKILWTRGHGESDPADYDPVTGMSDFARELHGAGYVVETVDLAEDGVPADCAVLVVAGARQPFSKDENARIDAFLDAHGGRLLVFADASRSGVASLLARRGLTISPFSIVSPKTVNGADVRVTAFGAHPVVRPLAGGALLFAGANPIAFSPVANVSFTPLAETGPESWGESEPGELPWVRDVAREPGGPLVPAAAIECGAAQADDLAFKPARAVVVADPAFALNGPLVSRANANRDFAVNAVAWLAGIDAAGASSAASDVLVTGMDRDAFVRFAAETILAFPLGTFLAGLLLTWFGRRRSAP